MFRPMPPAVKELAQSSRGLKGLARCSPFQVSNRLPDVTFLQNTGHLKEFEHLYEMVRFREERGIGGPTPVGEYREYRISMD